MYNYPSHAQNTLQQFFSYVMNRNTRISKSLTPAFHAKFQNHTTASHFQYLAYHRLPADTSRLKTGVHETWRVFQPP